VDTHHSGGLLAMATLTSSGGGLRLKGRWVSGNQGISARMPLAGQRGRRKTKVVTVLERFKANPQETRHLLRLEIGWYNEAAAEMFAMVVFVSDGLLQVNDTITTPAARYFAIARQLPLELQMVLCYRVVGSPREIIRDNDSEVAFKSLARRLTLSSIFAT